jgi:hypothetical protein
MKNGLTWHAWALICLAVLLVGAIDQKNRNALKVEQLLKTIEKDRARSGSPDRRSEVTERELNDYIGWRLSRERRSAVTHLKVHLLDSDQVQGKIVLDARQLNLGLFFGEALDFDFKGLLHSRRGAARLDLDTLKLHGEPVSPQTLDMVLAAVALCYGTQPTRIDDWYGLPKGMERIVVQKGKALLYY